jgi:predicted translin family RNA/ssDNA-binding protein
MPANNNAELTDKFLRDIYRAEQDVRAKAERYAEAKTALKDKARALPEYNECELAKQEFAEADAFLHGLIGEQTPSLFEANEDD